MGPNRPLVLAGHGVRAAGKVEEFHSWIERVRWPVVTTQLASDLMPWDHPLYVGHPGIKGDRAGNLAVQNCTQLYIIGCSLHPSTTGYNTDDFAPKAYKGTLDWDFPFLAMTMDLHWHERCRKWKETLMVRDEPHDRSDGLNYYDLIEALSQVTPGEATIVTDSGMSYYITGQAWRTKSGQRLISPGALAQMGYALPGVTGACFGAHGRLVVGIVGDGGFQTNIHELGVIAHHGLNAKIVVVNNNGYACIRNTQKNYFEKPYSGTDAESGVSFPKTEAVCDSYGIPYRNTDSSELSEMIGWLMGSDGPALLEVFTTPNQEFMPVVKSYRLPDGTMASGKLEDMYPPRG